MEYLEITGISFLLILCSITDIRERKIHISVCVIFMLVGIILELFIRQREVFDIFTGILPGIFIYIVCIATRGSIGRGDAVVFMIIGIFMGFIGSLCLFLSSLALVSIAAIFLLLFRKGDRRAKIPFIPFVMVSFFLMTYNNMI